MAIMNVTPRILRSKRRLESCDSSFYSSNKCVHTKKNWGSTNNTITYFWPLKFEKYRFFTEICKFSNTVFAGSITRLPIIGPVSCRIFPVQTKAPTVVLKFYIRNFMNHPYQHREDRRLNRGDLRSSPNQLLPYHQHLASEKANGANQFPYQEINNQRGRYTQASTVLELGKTNWRQG